MSAMQEMLLNMILPKEDQEKLKAALTPENIHAFINNVKTGYTTLTDQLNRIEQQNLAILEAMSNDNRGSRGKLRIASGDANSTGDAGNGTTG